MSIVEQIKARRLGLGLTQLQAAERMGVSQSYWADLESGRNPPLLGTLDRMAAAVDAAVDVRLKPLIRRGR